MLGLKLASCQFDPWEFKCKSNNFHSEKYMRDIWKLAAILLRIQAVKTCLRYLGTWLTTKLHSKMSYRKKCDVSIFFGTTNNYSTHAQCRFKVVCIHKAKVWNYRSSLQMYMYMYINIKLVTTILWNSEELYIPWCPNLYVSIMRTYISREEFWISFCSKVERTAISQTLLMMTSSNWNILRVTGHLWGGIHRSPVNSPHKGQWLGALMFSLICTRRNGWVNNGAAGDLRCHRAHYDVIVMCHNYQFLLKLD